ncbi:MAG TPA: DUF3365 domain-containing protein [Fimbriimonadaceae bacterium]|nr:DUF3365 domain-containing protein [Fimbriimonadaceae bacterium]
MNNLVVVAAGAALGAGIVVGTSFQGKPDPAEALVDGLHKHIEPKFKKFDGMMGLSRVAATRNHPTFNMGRLSREGDDVGLLTLAINQPDEKDALSRFGELGYDVRVFSFRPSQPEFHVSGFASGTYKEPVSIPRAEYEAFSKTSTSVARRDWDNASVNKLKKLSEGGWTYYYRPIAANKQECVTCHVDMDKRNLKVGDTVGIVCYAVRKRSK